MVLTINGDEAIVGSVAVNLKNMNCHGSLTAQNAN